MKLIQPRTDIGIAMMISGAFLQAFFGMPLGIAVACVGLVLTVYAVLRGHNPGTLMITALLVMSLGSLWFLTTRNSGPSDPPSMESVTSFAEKYRTALANDDLDAYLEIATPHMNDTLDEVFEVESQCLDWSDARFLVTPHGIASYMAIVTYSVAGTDVVREFTFDQYDDEWTVTAENGC